LSTMLNSITPFFIVDDLDATIGFYQTLGFEVRYKGGGDAEVSDSWVFLGRDQVMIMFKAIAPDVHPQPNSSRHKWARWDAYVNVDDPDGLHAEFAGRKVKFHQELSNTSDGLRAFEVVDNNGYVICFGRPVKE
jgi:catechol 2,3-dioxygenase-like lactoylglutathione lyase family enzyme